MRAWDVDWGSATAEVHIENAYADIGSGAHHAAAPRPSTSTAASASGSRGATAARRSTRACACRAARCPICVTPSSSTTIRSTGRSAASSASTAAIRGRIGFGRMTLDRRPRLRRRRSRPRPPTSASRATASASTRIEMAKSTGRVTGAAFVGWDGTYSFNADARRIPVEAIDAMVWPDMPLAGFVDFSASGSGDFRRSPLRRPRPHRRFLRARRGHRPGQRATRGARRRAQHRAARGRLAAPRRVRRRPRHLHAGSRRRPDAALHQHVDRSLRAPVRAAALAAHHRHRERHAPHRRSAARARAGASAEGVDRGSRSRASSTITCATTGPIRLAMVDDVARIERLRLVGEGTTLDAGGRGGGRGGPDARARHRRRQPGPAAGVLPRHSLVGPGAGAGRDLGAGARAGHRRHAPRSPTAACATSACRIRSTR